MAASALVALADGKVTLSESHRVDQVLEYLEQLRIFDVHEAIDLFHGFINGIREDPQVGEARALKAVAQVADNAEAARILVRVCIAVSQADGEVHPAEIMGIETICDVLGLQPAEFGL